MMLLHTILISNGRTDILDISTNCSKELSKQNIKEMRRTFSTFIF